jgi:hypothetical protein
MAREAKLVRNAQDVPHGMATTQHDAIAADRLPKGFTKAPGALLIQQTKLVATNATRTVVKGRGHGRTEAARGHVVPAIVTFPG